MNRVCTGNVALDSILGGGFPEYSINIIMGLPGTGKTILAEKVVFTNASPERPALYLSTVSEPLDKMLRYLQDFDYFDPEMIGESVIYHDMSDVLREHGVQVFADSVMALVKEHEPAYLVIDSFKALHAFCGSASEFRRTLTHLMTFLSSLAITSFLVGEYSTDEVASLPEFAVADGILELVLNKIGVKDARYLRVIKARGTAFLSGEHAFKINASGVDVFPRLQTPEMAIDYELADERYKTGVEVLDEMVVDGFWKGASTVVFGPPGCGKTLLGLHFIFKGIELGQKGLIATMQENPTQLQRVVAGFGWDLQAAIDSGMLDLMYTSAVDVYIDEFVAHVADRAEKGGAERVLIDSLIDLEASAPSADRFRDFLYTFVQSMAGKGISLLMTSEVKNLFESSIQTEFGISHMSDNVVLMHYVRQGSAIARAISVIKSRGSYHDPGIRRFEITPQGIKIGDRFEVVETSPGL